MSVPKATCFSCSRSLPLILLLASHFSSSFGADPSPCLATFSHPRLPSRWENTGKTRRAHPALSPSATLFDSLILDLVISWEGFAFAL